jgi:hypothetical protein
VCTAWFCLVEGASEGFGYCGEGKGQCFCTSSSSSWEWSHNCYGTRAIVGKRCVIALHPASLSRSPCPLLPSLTHLRTHLHHMRRPWR